MTGVQTCALPISTLCLSLSPPSSLSLCLSLSPSVYFSFFFSLWHRIQCLCRLLLLLQLKPTSAHPVPARESTPLSRHGWLVQDLVPGQQLLAGCTISGQRGLVFSACMRLPDVAAAVSCRQQSGFSWQDHTSSHTYTHTLCLSLFISLSLSLSLSLSFLVTFNHNAPCPLITMLQNSSHHNVP